ncbi:glycosyltransferase family 4 protein [Brevibacterium daeguense]|uniref:D-inositol 3-phosphate glycosyltransferase n=1 Tax=Brevibacterium daeguense TaxID=909936 RepID=A0ABP8EHF3_9MICO
MRILLLTHFYPPELGAPQRRWRELVSGFIAAGHQVAVCTPVPHYPHGTAAALGAQGTRILEWEDGTLGERILRLPYVPCSSSMIRQLFDQSVSSTAACLVGTTLRGNPPDVVISTSPGLPMLFTGDAIARMLEVPHVAEMRDAWPDLIGDLHLVRKMSRGLVPGALAEAIEQRGLPALFDWAERRADAVVVTTEGFAGRLRARGLRQVVCIRNTAVPYRPSAQYRDRAAGDPLRLLYVGTVGRSQGLDMVVRAVRAVPNVELRIVGAGAAKPALEVLAAPTSDRIRFSPQTTGEELEDLWRWADSGLVSLADVPAHEYTVPSKLYTLMARGVHITGILAGESAQIVEQSGAGHVVPPGNEQRLKELLKSLSSTAGSLRPSPEAQAWLHRNASPDSQLGAYLSLLEECVA